MKKLGWYLLLCPILALVMVGISIYHETNSPAAKAARAAEELQRTSESLFSGRHSDAVTLMTVVTSPQVFSPDGRIVILRAKADDGIPHMVFFYYSPEEEQSPCTEENLSPRLGDVIEVHLKRFRANGTWAAPIEGVVLADENSILFATPSSKKCK
jgi:hypothetical protein